MREELREEFSRLAQKALVEKELVRRRLSPNIKGFGATPGVCGVTGGGLDGAGSADSNKNSALVHSGKTFVKLERSFAEPADVWADFSAARAARNFDRRFVEIDVGEGRKRAGVAAAFEEFAVHVKDAPGPGLLVEIIYVLGAEKETIGERCFESREREVARIWFGGGRRAAAHGIEIPDEARVAAPSVGRCNIFESVVAPESARITECGDTALGADARTGEDEEVVGGRKRDLGHEVSGPIGNEKSLKRC